MCHELSLRCAPHQVKVSKPLVASPLSPVLSNLPFPIPSQGAHTSCLLANLSSPTGGPSAARSGGISATFSTPPLDGTKKNPAARFFAIIKLGNPPMPPRNRKNRLPAICCLLAVASFYSPLVAAVSAATGTSCCTGRQCSIALHHHADTPSNSQAHDCAHDALTLSACSMCCCRDSERTILPSGLFIVPEFAFLMGQAPPIVVYSVAYPLQFTFLPDLLSPPPRPSLLLL
jgi:hypothetical protein